MAQPFTRKLRVRLAGSPTEFGAKTHGPGTFEALLRQLLGVTNLALAAQYAGKDIYLLHTDDKPEGVYLHLVVYKHNDAVTAFGDPTKSKPTKLNPVPPPADSQYVDATLLFLVKGNDVFTCRSGTNSDQFLVAYVNQAAAQAGMPAAHYRFELYDRTNVDKLAAIKADGISSLSFNAAASEVAVQAANRSSTKEAFLGAVLDQMKSLGGAGVGQMAPAPNMKVEVKLVLDKRRAHLVTDPLVLRVATQAVADHDEGFKIVTASGKEISAEDVKLTKPAVMTQLGKHPDHESAWAKLREYQIELTTPKGAP